MDYIFNKTLLVIISLSSLILSSNAVPSTRAIDVISTSVPAAAPKSSFIDFTSKSFRAKAPSSIYSISKSFPAETPSNIDIISKSFPAETPSNIHMISKSFPAETPSSVEFISTKVDPEVLNICTEGGHKTKHCIETLSKLIKGHFDVVKTLEIKVNATLDIAKTLFDTIVKLRHDPSIDKRSIKPLNVCRKMYGNILDSINKTLEILPQQNFVDAHNHMLNVLSYKSACQDSWKLSHPGVNKRPWNVKPLTQSTAICVDILYYIVNNHKI